MVAWLNLGETVHGVPLKLTNERDAISHGDTSILS